MALAGRAPHGLRHDAETFRDAGISRVSKAGRSLRCGPALTRAVAASSPSGWPLPVVPDLASATVPAVAQAVKQLSNRVAIFVEPSPFSHVSGMKNRFECLIKCLRQAGDEVLVVTPDHKPPDEFCGAKVVNVLGFKPPFYSSPTLLLSTALSIRVFYYLWHLRPNVIHVSTPGVMVFAATMYAKLLRVPLIMSYHTHIPDYFPRYNLHGLVEPMWSVIRWCTRRSDLTLVTSRAMKEELSNHSCRSKSIDVWQRGVDTDIFNPKFRSDAMRQRLSGGHPGAPLLLYVGRLGHEKNCVALKEVLANVPGARLAIVGDGPLRAELEVLFAGQPVKFMGLMQGEELSAAYASADVFLMPSESETLGFVVLEAMAAGLPVVAVAAGGLTDLLTQQGVTGYLYPIGDYVAAAQLTRMLVASPELRKSVGGAARAEVEKFGWSAATAMLRDKQYGRAIKMSQGRRKFGFLALRVGVGRLLRLLFEWVWASVQWLVRQLDYARDLRTVSGSRGGPATAAAETVRTA